MAVMLFGYAQVFPRTCSCSSNRCPGQVCALLIRVISLWPQWPKGEAEELETVDMHGTDCPNLFCCLFHHWEPQPCTCLHAASFQSSKKNEDALPGMKAVESSSGGLRCW